MHLYTQLADTARRHGARTALIARHQRLTYDEVLAAASRFARALQALGVSRGDTVALLLPNCPEFTVAYYAAAAVGAVCVPANPLLKPAELTFIWNDCRARLVVTAAPLLAHVQVAREATPSIHAVVAVGDGELPPTVRSFDTLCNAEPDASALDATEGAADAPAVCIYTSGTEGRPKGALLSHRNLLANAGQVRRAMAIDERDNLLCALPLFHSFAGTVCQNTAIAAAACVTLIDQFHPARVAEAMTAHGVTIVPAVPAMYAAMLQLPADYDAAFAGVRLCVSGGAPLPVALLEAFERRFGTVILEGDGPTECGPVTAVNPLHGVRKPGTIGVPIPDVQMAIVDDDDRPIPPGQVGEIVVRGPNVMIGYLNRPDATAAAMRGGWYHTGDLGTMDDDGYFTIVDRKKDMLIVGGINVYPREVEEVLYRHPAIQDAAVVGGHDDRRGEQVVAVVALRPGMTLSARDVQRHCLAHLANYKCPRQVIFRESLPRSAQGKVLKRLLTKELDLAPPA